MVSSKLTKNSTKLCINTKSCDKSDSKLFGWNRDEKKTVIRTGNTNQIEWTTNGCTTDYCFIFRYLDMIHIRSLDNTNKRRRQQQQHQQQREKKEILQCIYELFKWVRLQAHSQHTKQHHIKRCAYKQPYYDKMEL